MSTHDRAVRATVQRSALTVALLLAVPLVGAAQEAPASASSSAAMDMDSMPGMAPHDMHGMAMPATTAKAAPVAPKVKSAQSPKKDSAATGMSGMDHQAMKPAADDSMPGMTHGDMHPKPAGITSKPRAYPPAHATMSGMNMSAMQGGSAPPGARSPDYSDGVSYGSMKPHMAGDQAIGMLLFDQLEAVHSHDGNAQAWEIEGSYGPDLDKLWVRTEGERSAGKIQDGDAEAFWYHGIATYWGSQLGVRHDFGVGPQRNWAAFGVEGLAPYFFEVQATGYVGSAGRTAARFRADYEILFTQRLILQPELEFNLYGKDDPARKIGRGLSDVSLGLRLRYEIRRQFAPYIGINWVRRVGKTADYARADGEHVFDQQLVAGIRFWF